MGIDLQLQRAINAADPSSPTDLATKQYVDLYVNGITLKTPVRAATTAAITLSGVQTIDGVAVVANDRVLVKNQGSALTNGIYVANAGAWVRATDADASAEVVAGMTVFVTEGGTNGDKQFSLITDGVIVLNTTALAFAQTSVSAIPYVNGNGINLAGNVFSAVAKPGGSLGVDAGGIFVDSAGPLAAKRYAVQASTTVTSTVTHSLNTLNVVTQIYIVATGEMIDADVFITGVNSLTVTFASAPTAGQFNIVVLG